MEHSYIFQGSEFSFFSTRRFDLSDCLDKPLTSISLDLSKVNWITPYGIVFLFAAVSQLREMQPNCRININFPPGTEMFAYACRMDLPQSLIQIPDVIVTPDVVRQRRINRRSSLCEFRTIELATEDDADSVAEELLGKIVRSQITDDEETNDLINTALSELLSNVYVHSQQSRALVAAQTYAPVRKPKTVSIAIGDTGIGIPQSLIAVQGGLKDDKTLIRESLIGGVSARGEGGYGLTDINSTLTQNTLWDRRILMIRSNGGWLWSSGSDETKEPLKGDVSFQIRGTYAGILLKKS